MNKVGHIQELWRYPVSSTGGEMCNALSIDERGLEGDRRFGLFETETGAIATPEKDPRWRPALLLGSRVGETGETLIRFPGDQELSIEDRHIVERLSAHFGFGVSLGKYPDVAEEISPRLPVIGRAYKASPLHLLSSSSVRQIEGRLVTQEADRRRFRPSLLLDTALTDDFPEDGWIGAILHIGSVRAIVIERTKRCGVTLIPQPDLPEQPEVLRTILRTNHRCLGVYCDVIDPGILQVGMDVFIED